MNVSLGVNTTDMSLIRWQMHCHLLDQEFHTPALVCSRSPFLLTSSMLLVPYLLKNRFHQNRSLRYRLQVLHAPSRASCTIDGACAKARFHRACSRLQISWNRTSLSLAHIMGMWCCWAVWVWQNMATAWDGYPVGYLLSCYLPLLTLRFEGWPPTSICTARRHWTKILILRKVVRVTRKYIIASVRGSCALRLIGARVHRWANLIRYAKSRHFYSNVWMTWLNWFPFS